MNSEKPGKISAETALQLLKDGNDRFMKGLRSVESMIRSRDLFELAEKGQRPFAIVLACADSRVPIEILFDRGPGDIFVCRVAGNVVTPSILGSIEFAAEKFESPLCVVMGHTRCGAVEAAISTPEIPADLSPNLRTVLEELEPAARIGRDLGPLTPQVLDRTCVENVRHSMESLRTESAVITRLVEKGQLKLAGAICDIHTGAVTFGIQ